VVPFDISAWKVKVPLKIKGWFPLKIIWLRENGNGIPSVVFVVNMRLLFIISFLLPDRYACLEHN
jgi:hypothetical protein